MSKETDIQWTDATANVVVGCTRVSRGCERCYAERLAATRLRDTPRYKGLAVVTEGGRPRWSGEVRLVQHALEELVRWGRGRRVFLTAMGDPFHAGLTDAQVAALFGVMALAPQHTFQVLTKRPERAAELLPKLSVEACLNAVLDVFPSFAGPSRSTGRAAAESMRAQGRDPETFVSEHTWPMPHVWLGTSVEDQGSADERIPHLLRTPAALRFLSCEPLLGPVDLRLREQWCWCVGRCEGRGAQVAGTQCVMDTRPGRGLYHPDSGGYAIERPRIAWVIAGGESGPKARPFDVAWARSIVEQCRAAKVPAFVKQLGAAPVDGGRALELRDSHGGDPAEWAEDLRVREFPGVRS